MYLSKLFIPILKETPSSNSLYLTNISTYGSEDKFDHNSAVGFIDIYSLPSRIQRKQQIHDEMG